MSSQGSHITPLHRTAMVIAEMVRDGLEDLHVRGDIPDTLMPELNMRIRNAIYTAAYALEHAETDCHCDDLLEEAYQGIPSYWEIPQLWARLASPRTDDPGWTRYLQERHRQKYGTSDDSA
jgi:hypothetical protein